MKKYFFTEIDKDFNVAITDNGDIFSIFEYLNDIEDPCDSYDAVYAIIETNNHKYIKIKINNSED